jgi:hypothetical protein
MINKNQEDTKMTTVIIMIETIGNLMSVEAETKGKISGLIHLPKMMRSPSLALYKPCSRSIL